jgi:hypothetical protein
MGKHNLPRAVESRGDRIGRSNQKWMFGAGAATLLASGISILAHDQDPINDIIHHLTAETATETNIANAVNEALGTQPVIHCVAKTELDANTADIGITSTLGATTIEAFTGTTMSIRLDKGLCDSLAELPAAFSADEQATYHTNAAQALALQILGHEMTHYGDGISDEGVANCRSFQYVEPLTRAFGASPAEAFEARNTAAHLFSPPQQAGSEYATHAKCFEGGLEDLGLNGSNGYWPPVGSVVIQPLYDYAPS